MGKIILRICIFIASNESADKSDIVSYAESVKEVTELKIDGLQMKILRGCMARDALVDLNCNPEPAMH